MTAEDDLALFAPELVQLEPLKPTDEAWGAVGVKYSRHKGAHRACDECARRIHADGVAGAPAPRAAIWRRKGPNGDEFLCSEDAEIRKRLDERAGALKQARTEINTHRPARKLREV